MTLERFLAIVAAFAVVIAAVIVLVLMDVRLG